MLNQSYDFSHPSLLSPIPSKICPWSTVGNLLAVFKINTSLQKMLSCLN